LPMMMAMTDCHTDNPTEINEAPICQFEMQIWLMAQKETYAHRVHVRRCYGYRLSVPGGLAYREPETRLTGGSGRISSLLLHRTALAKEISRSAGLQRHTSKHSTPSSRTLGRAGNQQCRRLGPSCPLSCYGNGKIEEQENLSKQEPTCPSQNSRDTAINISSTARQWGRRDGTSWAWLEVTS
jgi:hypothetical protein